MKKKNKISTTTTIAIITQVILFACGTYILIFIEGGNIFLDGLSITIICLMIFLISKIFIS